MIRPDPPSPLQPTVLVVDADAAVRRLLEAALPRHGLAVLSAAGVEEAVEVYRRNRGAVAVVLLDWDGPATLDALRAAAPLLPCCLMSAKARGYAADNLLSLGVDYFFEKPFGSLGGLADMLRRAAASP
jgi:DNA-binding NtrC family response regulator